MAPPNFSGTWELTSSEGFEKLKEFAAGMGQSEDMMGKAMMIMQAGKRVIKQDGDNFCVTLVMGDKTEDIKFTIGQEFKKEIEGQLEFTALPTWDGDKLVMDVTRKMGVNEVHLKVIREKISDTELNMWVEMGDIKCKANYKKTA